jgi:hypothetical protein
VNSFGTFRISHGHLICICPVWSSLSQSQISLGPLLLVLVSTSTYISSKPPGPHNVVIVILSIFPAAVWSSQSQISQGPLSTIYLPLHTFRRSLQVSQCSHSDTKHLSYPLCGLHNHKYHKGHYLIYFVPLNTFRQCELVVVILPASVWSSERPLLLECPFDVPLRWNGYVDGTFWR